MGTASVQFSSLSAAERVAALVDPGTLIRFAGNAAADSAAWIGAGQIAGHQVLLALTDGHQRGGTVGVHEAGMLAQLTDALTAATAAVIVCWDTGGVRVEEGPVALATASAVGVALARLSLTGPRLVTIISGPRGCFGAPSVMAALSHLVIMTEEARWGLTGPKLLRAGEAPAEEYLGLTATSAAHRFKAGHADAVVPDAAVALRAQLAAFLARRWRPPGPARALGRSVADSAKLLRQVKAGDAGAVVAAGAGSRHQRDLLRFSFRGHWRPTGPVLRRGLVHAAWGLLDERPALGIIVGYERARDTGVGIEEASAVSEIVRFATTASAGEPAPIFTFLFCQGHAIDLGQERFGLHRALAECLRSFVAARLLGHPLLCVLGGGAYGAAYLSLAAPSHRILAMKGTTVAPMAPRVLAAFRSLRGMREAPETPAGLAELIPEIRMVDSVIRLPRVLREELDALLATVRPSVTRRKRRPADSGTPRPLR
ncbi:MAG: hypothetical protein HY699_10550 [Deltaproteobacteria bacterium]|nr:hypothetical protein [Deltaproteobacteria bacterium]